MSKNLFFFVIFLLFISCTTRPKSIFTEKYLLKNNHETIKYGELIGHYLSKLDEKYKRIENTQYQSVLPQNVLFEWDMGECIFSISCSPSAGIIVNILITLKRCDNKKEIFFTVKEFDITSGLMVIQIK